MFFKSLQQVRESKKGDELKTVNFSFLIPSWNSLIAPQELQKLRRLIDSDPKLFTTDVLLRLMLTYRDIQVRKIAYTYSIKYLLSVFY